MSSQFNYELDERQIRLLMQGVELDYNESIWVRFESTQMMESKSKMLFKNQLPQINLGISRSIIIPVLFVIAIGGLSSLLFSFVDFKKKPEEIRETPLKITNQAADKPFTVNSEKQTNTKNNIFSASSNSVASLIKPIIKADTAIKTAENFNKIVKKTVEKDIITKDKATTQKEKILQTKQKKKQRQKMISEELPTIHAEIKLDEGMSEPELDLK